MGYSILSCLVLFQTGPGPPHATLSRVTPTPAYHAPEGGICKECNFLPCAGLDNGYKRQQAEQRPAAAIACHRI